MKEETLYKGEKPLDKMSDTELTNFWNKNAERKFYLDKKLLE